MEQGEQETLKLGLFSLCAPAWRWAPTLVPLFPFLSHKHPSVWGQLCYLASPASHGESVGFLSGFKSRSWNPVMGQPLGIFIPQSTAQSISPWFTHCPCLWNLPLFLLLRPYWAGKLNKPCLFLGSRNAHTVQGSEIQSSRSNSFRICILAQGTAVLPSIWSSPASHAPYTLQL